MASTCPESENPLRACALCPRECRADRLEGRLGWCRTGTGFAVGAICVHRGEEPVLGGERGIVNVFFARCNLRCMYCQNHQISRTHGAILEHALSEANVLRRIETALAGGPRHVGLVSPSHVVPQAARLIGALRLRPAPPVVVWNSNAYEKADTLRALEGLVDVYLPDLKYMDDDLAERLSGARDYPPVAARAIREMARQKGTYLSLGEDGLAESGLIVRHLVLPGQVENSRRCLRWLAEEVSPAVHLSLLAQYEPTPAVADDPDLSRRLRPEEYEEVADEMRRLGFFRGYTQSLAAAPNYNPDFAARHPFEP